MTFQDETVIFAACFKSDSSLTNRSQRIVPPMSDPLMELVQNLGHPRVLVLGDAILDRYIWGNAERVSQEAPVILLRADQDEIRLGGAEGPRADPGGMTLPHASLARRTKPASPSIRWTRPAVERGLG